ncbi:MAG: hypothetical protein A2Z37_01325 [Chloroflexi bacterium RBG_19FT_COMBO_62_14]|nr:MAG: hypothetical protein A2Z37_01325 [Chloroflexi bacterium RBG_19FT_COMBO_62_14]
MAGSLEERVGLGLKAHGWTLAVAESCTGGLVADRITDVAGSSGYFLGGVVAYSNRAKERFLGVRGTTLEAHGAVSEETAIEMAQGARRVFGADVAVAVTGIAGPGGGQPEKPVGLTWLGFSGPSGERAERHLWPGDRRANKAQSAEAALAMLLKELGNTDG